MRTLLYRQVILPYGVLWNSKEVGARGYLPRSTDTIHPLLSFSSTLHHDLLASCVCALLMVEQCFIQGPQLFALLGFYIVFFFSS